MASRAAPTGSRASRDPAGGASSASPRGQLRQSGSAWNVPSTIASPSRSMIAAPRSPSTHRLRERASAARRRAQLGRQPSTGTFAGRSRDARDGQEDDTVDRPPQGGVRRQDGRDDREDGRDVRGADRIGPDEIRDDRAAREERDGRHGDDAGREQQRATTCVSSRAAMGIVTSTVMAASMRNCGASGGWAGRRRRAA